MHWADINAALIKKGSSCTKIAEELGVAQCSVSMVIHSKDTSYNIATAIAAKTGIPLNKLWPCGKYAQPPIRGRNKRAKRVA